MPTQPALKNQTASPYSVRRQTGSKQWAVYRGSLLIEGGFFSRDAAEDCADQNHYDDRHPYSGGREERSAMGITA